MTNAAPIELLRAWLDSRVPPTAAQWLADATSAIQANGFRSFSPAFSMTSRKLGKADLSLDAESLLAALSSRSGWDPSRWTVDQAGRTVLVLTLAHQAGSSFDSLLSRVFAAADVGEMVTLYQALPLLPDQKRWSARAAEGVRSNMRSVFEAVAHRNPYPAEQLAEGPWNQMVLKALFIGSRLDPIVGLDRRSNPALARMLWDYSKERRAAHRPVNPELWRCIGPFADEQETRELTRLLSSADPLERQGAALALASAPSADARRAVESDTEASRCVQDTIWTWADIAAALDQQVAT